MKLLGMLLVVCACAGMGFAGAARLKREAAALDALCAWTDDAAGLIRHQRTELGELLRMLSVHPGYAAFSFMREIADGLSPCTPPGLLWEQAVRCDRMIPQAAQIPLIRVGQTLGATDPEGALAALSLCRTQLLRIAEEARETSRVKGKLCRALGLLGGCMAAVLLV